MTGSLWILFTVLAAGAQTLRNAMQKELTATIGTIGATHVRFLFGLPFAALILAIVLAITGEGFPALNPRMLAWSAFGAASQIAATALLLAAMRDKSFVLITALNKLEPVHVALFGLVLLGDRLSVPIAAAIAIATAGVVVMSWPKPGAAAGGQPKRNGDSAAAGGQPKRPQEEADGLGLKPIVLGLAAGAAFGISAVGYRGGILALDHRNFVVAATTTVFVGLLMQTVVLTLYLVLFDRTGLAAIVRAWRQSMVAGFMGAFASEMWFLAFALQSAAKVRTLALVEIFFAGLVSRSLFKQGLASREGLGILLIVAGVALLLNLSA